MSASGVNELVDSFTQRLTAHLDQSKLDGPVRLDNTHTVVIIPVKGKGPVHAHIQGGIDEAGVANILSQLRAVPSLQALVKSE